MKKFSVIFGLIGGLLYSSFGASQSPVSGLPAAGELDGTNILLVIDGITKRTTLSNILYWAAQRGVLPSYVVTPSVSTNSIVDTRGRPGLGFPLSVPTSDGYPQIVHPNVICLQTNWPNQDGYRWWMAFCPFPGTEREAPSIVASRNGLDWTVPAGLVNPIVIPYGFPGQHAADTELVYVPASNCLACFYLVGSTAIFRSWSTNGVNWDSNRCIQLPNSIFADPEVVVETNGTMAMWIWDYVNDDLYRWSSTDAGLTWNTNSGLCSNIFDVNLKFINWHFDVQKVGSNYHALFVNATESVGGYLNYGFSTNGYAWIVRTNVIPVVTNAYSQGWYKTCMVPVSENPLRFDVYSGTWYSGTLDTSNPGFRLVYFPNMSVDSSYPYIYVDELRPANIRMAQYQTAMKFWGQSFWFRNTNVTTDITNSQLNIDLQSGWLTYEFDSYINWRGSDGWRKWKLGRATNGVFHLADTLGASGTDFTNWIMPYNVIFPRFGIEGRSGRVDPEYTSGSMFLTSDQGGRIYLGHYPTSYVWRGIGTGGVWIYSGGGVTDRRLLATFGGTNEVNPSGYNGDGQIRFMTNISAQNGFTISTNRFKWPPSAPVHPGDMFFWSSNGFLALLQSTNQSATWNATNWIGVTPTF